MKALVFDKELQFKDIDKPVAKDNEVLIRVLMAGICNTDIEITKGYMGFNGVLGHEFVGVVETAKDTSLIGKRVVGEINCGCDNCPACAQSMQRHCPSRETLGIVQKDGCFAQYITLPVENIVVVPDTVANEEAVLVEPLAAALEILEQVHIQPDKRVAVLGDGKLGLLIAFALSTTNAEVTLVGKHQDKLDIVNQQGIKTCLLSELKESKSFDLVVEATGSITGFETAISLVKPRGSIILKSTIATGKEFNLAPIVIDEISIIGSRCGQFKPAVRFLEKKLFDLKPLITEIFKFDDALDAIAKSNERGVLKVLLKF